MGFWRGRPDPQSRAAYDVVVLIQSTPSTCGQLRVVTDPDKSFAEAFGSTHSRSFPPLMQQLRSSLLVTTFQTRMLIVVRSDGETLHTDFVPLKRPMGIAADSKRIIVGGRDRVYEFRNMPTLTGSPASLEAPRGSDAVYLMRNVHITGGLHSLPTTRPKIGAI